MITGCEAELALRYVGLLRRLDGRSARAALIAACTSRAAESMFFDRSNCMLMRVEPFELCEVISFRPAMMPRRRSRGVATLEAMVCGLPPGMLACTNTAGKSTF